MTDFKKAAGQVRKWFNGPLLYVFLVLLCALAINIVVGFTIIKPETDKISMLDKRADMRRRAGTVEKALADVERFEQEHLLEQTERTRVVNDVFRVAKKNGVKIRGGDYSPDTTTSAGFSRYTISFPVEGGYKQIKKFVYDIETLEHSLVIEEIGFERNSRGARGTIELTIKLSAYFRQQAPSS